MNSYKAIGLMSGTSLDGVDIAACDFFEEDDRWSYKILAAHTYPYPEEWQAKLSQLPSSDALTFARVNVEYGHFLGQLVKSFMFSTGYRPDIVASHGHTIFHQPHLGFTCQIGSGSAIAAETGISVVCDFRSLDVALGGQGAPLVPMGDKLLFGEYDACLNLGGFANISMEHENQRIAFDICPLNYVLNLLAGKLGMAFDKNGEIARSGSLDEGLLDDLNQLDFYSTPYPKSLGREWVEMNILPVLFSKEYHVPDLLRTFTEHISKQINRIIDSNSPGKVLTTGGGSKNEFLIERMSLESHHSFYIPGPELVDFKEALIFAFLGILRYVGRNNVLNSVTGSKMAHSGGSVYRI